MAKYVNVERQIGLNTAFAHLFDHDSSAKRIENQRVFGAA